MNNIEKLVLEMIGEDTDNPDVFIDTAAGMEQIRDSINDAIEEIAIITGAYKETFYLPLREGRSFYRFDDLDTGGDVAWITDAFITTNRRRLEQTDLTRLCMQNPRFLIDSGTPLVYFPIGLDYLGIWPKPGADTDIVEVTAVIVPIRYTADTDRIKLRKDLKWATVNFAVGEYYASRGDAKKAIEHHNLYLQDLGIDLPYYTDLDYNRLRTEKEPWPKTG